MVEITTLQTITFKNIGLTGISSTHENTFEVIVFSSVKCVVDMGVPPENILFTWFKIVSF